MQLSNFTQFVTISMRSVLDFQFSFQFSGIQIYEFINKFNPKAYFLFTARCHETGLIIFFN